MLGARERDIKIRVIIRNSKSHSLDYHSPIFAQVNHPIADPALLLVKMMEMTHLEALKIRLHQLDRLPISVMMVKGTGKHKLDIINILMKNNCDVHD